MSFTFFSEYKISQRDLYYSLKKENFFIMFPYMETPKIRCYNVRRLPLFSPMVGTIERGGGGIS